jgi:hypothetical protein
MTGVQPERHKVFSNNLSNYKSSQYPDFLTRIEQVNTAFSTFSITDWAPLATTTSGGPLISDAVDVRMAVDVDFYG